jgi:hypothetical protein
MNILIILMTNDIIEEELPSIFYSLHELYRSSITYSIVADNDFS